jgi:hypothetical protein
MFSEHGTSYESEPTPSDQIRQYARESFDASVGLILIVVGAIFLAQQFLGFNPWRWSWPYFVITPGVLFLTGAFAFGRRTSGLAIPGTIITTLGLILLVQNTLNAWSTWTYAWALVVPTSIGVGIWLHGVLSGRVRPQRVGRVMASVGLVLFLGFTTLFEGIIGINGGIARGIGGPGIAVVLIVGGLYLISERPKDSTYV